MVIAYCTIVIPIKKTRQKVCIFSHFFPTFLPKGYAMLIVQEYKIIHPLISPGAHLGFVFRTFQQKQRLKKALDMDAGRGTSWPEGKYVPKRMAGEGARYITRGC